MYERCYSGLGEELLKQFCTLVMQKALFLRLIFIITLIRCVLSG